MGPIHLGHEVHASSLAQASSGRARSTTLRPGEQDEWVLSAAEVRQNDLCSGKDGWVRQIDMWMACTITVKYQGLCPLTVVRMSLRFLVVEWWADTAEPASSVGLISLTLLKVWSGAYHHCG